MASHLHLHFLIYLLIATCLAVEPDVGVPICVPAAGEHINLGHCEYVLANRLQNAQDNINLNPGGSLSNQPFSHAMSYIFSGASTDPSTQLPAFFCRRNCLIVVGTEDSSLHVTGLWADLRLEATKLVNACVRDKNGQGGHLRLASGLYVEVWQPACYVAMAVDTHRSSPACLITVRPQGNHKWEGTLLDGIRNKNLGATE